MKKALIRKKYDLYFYEDSKKIEGPNSNLEGDCSGISGDCTGISGNINDCDLVEVTDIEELIKE